MIFKTNCLMALVCLLGVVACNEVKHNSTNSEVEKSRSPGVVVHRKSREMKSYVRMISCAMKYDTVCLLDVAERFLEDKRHELLAQADAEAVRATGRSDNDSKPSQLASALGRLFTEITSLFRNGISGIFKETKEADEDLDEDDDEKNNETEDEKNGTARSSNGAESGRAQKKKTKKLKGLKGLVRLLKVAIIAGIVVLKITVLIKFLQTALQFKLMLVAVGGFAIQVVKFWQSLKDKDHHDHEEISYQNPYLSASPGGLGGVDFQGGYPGAEYGPARSFDINSGYAQNGGYAQDREYAQNMAYNTEKP